MRSEWLKAAARPATAVFDATVEERIRRAHLIVAYDRETTRICVLAGAHHFHEIGNGRDAEFDSIEIVVFATNREELCPLALAIAAIRETVSPEQGRLPGVE